MERFVEIAAAGAERPALREDLDTGLGELGAHDPRNGAADDPGDDREDQIEGADVLVISRQEPTGKKGRLVIGVMMRLMRLMAAERKRVGGDGAHDLVCLPLINSGPLQPG